MAGDIHARPEEARELLIDFAEFTRYLFRDGRSYVTLAEELTHVERYLRLEQARFRDRLHVTFDVPAEHPVRGRPGDVGPAAGRERGPPRRRAPQRRVAAGSTITARVVGGDIELRVSDDGSGIEPERMPALLAGAGGGIGLSNVDARLRATFGERYCAADRVRAGTRHDGGDDRAQPRRGEGAAGPVGPPPVARQLGHERRAADHPGRRRRAHPARGPGPAAAQLTERRARSSARSTGTTRWPRSPTQRFDAIFLDVRMPDLDGLELGRVLRRFASPPQLVFVSAYDGAAVEAFELHALDYLRKPVGRRRVEEAVERVSAAVDATPGAERQPARPRRLPTASTTR